MAQMYMLIDRTVLTDTKVIVVGDMHRVQMWGQILKAQGKNVLAPPIEGRGFSKLEKLELQYLFWNHCKRAPPEDFTELIQQCLTQIKFIKPDDHLIQDLERQVAKLESEREEVAPKPKKEKPVKDPSAPVEAPKKTSTTGLVWVLADEISEKAGRLATRPEVMAACTEEGINPSTAGTQYSKWAKAAREKGSKNIANT